MSPRLSLLVLGLAAAAVLSGVHLDRVSREEGLTASASGIPLGGFEPLAVNLLWLRAEEETREGRYPEAAAAYRLVTELQPQIGEASALAAHLLAWTTSRREDPDEEWRWVEQAVRILEGGLEHSPDSAPILVELGYLWLFRVCRDEALHARAEAELGRPPEAEAVDAFRRLASAAPDDARGKPLLADAAAALGDLRFERKEWGAARHAYGIALPLYREFAADDGGEELVPRIAEIQGRLRECESHPEK
jgi:tetratricopeptide (TPR) repeat protein